MVFSEKEKYALIKDIWILTKFADFLDIKSNKYTNDSLGGHPEVLLDEVKGHCQRDQGNNKSQSDGGNDPDGRQAEQRGSGQRLQRWRYMLRAKRDNGFRLGLFTGDGTNQLLLLTWSMMLVSAENLFRIWPRGVTSKNLSREEIKIPHTHSESFFFLIWHLKVMLPSRQRGLY